MRKMREAHKVSLLLFRTFILATAMMLLGVVPGSSILDIRRYNPKRLFAPSGSLVTPNGHAVAGRDTLKALEGEGSLMPAFDPNVLGYHGEVIPKLGGIFTHEDDVLDYSSGGTDSSSLSKDRVITAILIVADPYRHDVTTGAITVVQDAVDKIMTGLSIASGKATYYQLSSSTLYLKALGNLNKLLYPGLMHEDLATAVATDNDSYQAWLITFGAFNDFDPFDASAGIPAEDVDSLSLRATWATNQLIAVTAADGTIDANTDLYVITMGVQGLSKGYRQQLPRPDFRYQHATSVTDPLTFDLPVGRYLKRTTIVNLAVAASNNEPRNDANITDITLESLKPSTSKIVDSMRWRQFKALSQPWMRGGAADRDGAVALTGGGLDGVAVIDWRRWTHNPFGLNLYGMQQGDLKLRLTMATTTGSIHLYHEMYDMPNPAVGELWNNHAWRPQ